MNMNSNKNLHIKKSLSILLIILCLIFSWSGLIDKGAKSYVNDAIVQATLAFGSARALNAAISVAQSAEFGVSFGGEASFHPLEILDPVNDMVEDFSTVMKYSIGSLIIQKLLIEILATKIIKWILLFLGLLLIVGILFKTNKFNSVLLKSFYFIVLIRFATAIIVFLVSIVDSSFIIDKTDNNIKIVNYATESIGFENDSESSLSPEKIREINRSILELNELEESIEKKIRKNKEIISDKEKDLEVEKDHLDIIRKELGIIKRISPLNNNNEIDEEKIKINKIKESYYSTLIIQDELNDELREIKEQKTNLIKEAKGEDSFLSKLKRKVSMLKSIFNSQKTKEALKKSIEGMLNLIALFIFKTIILPVAFLFFFLRLFKFFFGTDLIKKVNTNNIP